MPNWASGSPSIATPARIRISDNGVGLSRDEAIANLGTIARSGTREFFSRLTGDAAKDSNLIGQFGVGFYSSFIVAKRVVVESRRAGLPAAEGVRWTSEGGGEFTVETIERAQRGTDVTLYLRDNEPDAERRPRVRLAARGLQAAQHRAQLLGPHLAADPDEEDAVGQGQAEDGRDRRMGDGQPGARAVAAAEERADRERLPRVLPAPERRYRCAACLHPQPGGRAHRIHAAAVRAAPRAVRPLGPPAAPRHPALRPARLHHGRRRAADAGVPALRQGRSSIPTTCRSTSRARSCRKAAT